MDTRSKRILSMLGLPKYETTKGLDNGLKAQAITSLKANLLREDYMKNLSNESDIVDSSSGTPMAPTVNEEANFQTNEVLCFQPSPKDIPNKENHSVNNNNITSLDKESNALHFEDISDEDKTSGSEYMPSDDDSTTSEEEIVQEINSTNVVSSSCKKVYNKRKYKTKTNNKSKRRNITISEPKIDGMPDSTTIKDKEEPISWSPKSVKNKIKVLAAGKSNGKLIRNKGHACYFCQKVVQNSARHFELLHGKETDVAKILAKPKGSKERREGFANLIRTGDFYHNTTMLATKQGQLILVRRPTENEAKFVSSNDYGPCPHCLGFMLKKHLWHHVKNSCTAKNRSQSDQNTNIIAESDALINDAFGSDFSREFVTNISSKFREDEIGNYCKEDILIQRFGAMLFEKYGTTQTEMIRQSMRQLARLTLKLREIGTTKKTLTDFLVPQMFDQIIQATKSLCITHQNSVRRPEFEIPSLALKTGYALKKCAAIKRGRCLRAGNLTGNEIINSFLSLMELEWNTRISSNALATLYTRKFNATQLLPLTSDLIKLSQYLNNEMKKERDSLTESPSLKIWSNLASLTLSKLILFNKRRSGEASRMTLYDYTSRPQWHNQCTEELKKSLTDFEKKLADQLTIIEIVGKRGRKVPVLLTQDVKASIDILLQTRDKVAILKENPFVFPRTGNSLANIRGHDSLRKACFDAYLEHPENITSTKLRKYIATVCQVFNLSENDYDWLARHLGHDIRVHREFYRLHESAVELTKVSRLLIAVDKGEVNAFAGKNLEEINLEDIPNAEEQSDDEEDEDIDEEMLEDHMKNKNLQHNEKTHFARKQKTSNEQHLSAVQVAPREAQAKTKNGRRPWSSAEKMAVLNFFISSINRSVVPGKAECTKCLEDNVVLASRSWTDVKFCVKNHLDKIKKQKKI